MPEIDTVRKIAQQVLTASTDSASKDNWIWDRTCRILRNLEHICRQPELARQALSIDHFCLQAAACFAESGVTLNLARKNTPAQVLSSEVSLPDLCSSSIQVVSERLSGLLHDKQIDKINKIITESCNRLTNMTEAMVLSDARNLEDMGAIGLLHEFRRNILQGKCISDILESWKCKIEYGYWQARLKESFRFDVTRNIAQQRFKTAEHFMVLLAGEHTARDLNEHLMGILKKT